MTDTSSRSISAFTACSKVDTGLYCEITRYSQCINLCTSASSKRDVLNYYTNDSGENGKTQTVMSSGYDKLMSSYPDNCIDIEWKKNHTYVINYGLNNKKYVHEFFIDSAGTLTK